jgi:hypothetical protein
MRRFAGRQQLVMRSVRFVAICFAALAVTGSVQARTDVAAPGAPTGLRAFLLRPSEAVTHEFARTPSFSWLPVRGAMRYEFELSKTPTFNEAGTFWSDEKLKTPAVSVPVALPWLTGTPYAVYARVRAITRDGVSAWSSSFGFNVRWGNLPQAIETAPGMSRWSVVDGATSYQVWFPDLRKIVGTRTNAVDHREFYAFHPQPAYSGIVRWRVRAVRSLYGKIPSALPAVSYGPWSLLNTTENPVLADGTIAPTLAVADATVSNANAASLHQLTPGFSFAGTRAATGAAFPFYRVYVFSDSDCVNVIHRGSLVASPAYVPRTTGSLKMPLTAADVILAGKSYLKDMKVGEKEAPQFMFDSAKVSSTESDPAPAKQVATPVTPATGGTGSTPTPTPPSTPGPAEEDPANTPPANDPSLPASPAASGAPVDLWDSGWPNGRFFWTVVPVAFESSTPTQTALAQGTAPGAGSFRIASSTGFAAGQLIRIGSDSTQETLVIASVDTTLNQVITTTGSTYAHGVDELVQNLTATLDYWDQELPQDLCAAGRVQSFGKGSRPLVAGSASPFASGLSPRGLLTTAARTVPSFYGTPLVAWQPALGADQYQVQWSKKSYPWVKVGEKFTYATSALLPLEPGLWYYRVRGVNFSLPGSARAMSWSAPVGVRVAKPTFAVVKKSGR